MVNKYIYLTLRFIFLVTISFWLGTIFFFSVIAAQTIFLTLPADQAGKLISLFFDKYYNIQYIFGLILLVASFLLWTEDSFSLKSFRLFRLIIIFIMFISIIYSGNVIRKSAIEAKQVMKIAETTSQHYVEANERFRASHRNSVILNGLVFLMGIVILYNVSNKNKI